MTKPQSLEKRCRDEFTTLLDLVHWNNRQISDVDQNIHGACREEPCWSDCLDRSNWILDLIQHIVDILESRKRVQDFEESGR